MGPRPHKPSPIQEVVRGWSMTPSYWYEEWRKERAKVAALEAEQRLMQAEAQLLREEQGADEAVKHIMELETEVERLRKQRREGWRQVAAIPVHRLTDDRGVVVEDAIPRVRVLDLLGEVNP